MGNTTNSTFGFSGSLKFDHEDLAKKLNELQRKNLRSKEELNEFLGFTPSTVQNFREGKRGISLSSLRKLKKKGIEVIIL